MVNFNDIVVKIINESKPLVFPPELEKVYEKIIKHIESYSAPKEWSQGIYMPKEIHVWNGYDGASGFPESKEVEKLLGVEPRYNQVTGGLDSLRNYINTMVTNGLKADKISKKYPKAYSKGSLSANFRDNINYDKAPMKYKRAYRPLKNDNDIKKMFYRAILDWKVKIPKVPEISIKVNLNGVEDELQVDFFEKHRRPSEQSTTGSYLYASWNFITINLPQIMTGSVRVSSVKDFSTQWPKSYSSNPKMDNLKVSHILQMFDTRNTKRVYTVIYVKETVRHELMHYYDLFFKRKNISLPPDEAEIDKFIAADQYERKALWAKKQANYLTRNTKIAGRIANEFYPRLRELLETVPKDTLELFLRTLNVKLFYKFYRKKLGMTHAPTSTKKEQPWEQWLTATLKVPYLKRKLLEKIYNFINDK